LEQGGDMLRAWRQLGKASLCLCSLRLLPWRGRTAWLRPSLRRSSSAPGKNMPEPWRLSRHELRDLLTKYEKAVEEDSYFLLRPSVEERRLLGEEVLKKRAEAVKRARDANRKFIEALIDDLPDLCVPDSDKPPPRPLAEIRELSDEALTLSSNSYGSISSVFLHLLRDWSTNCDHVGVSTYGPATAELRALLPQGGEVLLPGAGLGRLAFELAGCGYKVEANDGSRLFMTAADFLLNRCPEEMVLYPMAHVFSENWSHGQQYLEIKVPSPPPARVAGVRRPAISLVPGDFVKTYKAGGVGHRKFDAIVTCFFVDTTADIAELFGVLDSLLNEGGVWVNVGPLNWRKEARLKLTWEEVVSIWKGQGYEFVSEKSTVCDYHMPRGAKMYTESYNCALTAAVKRQKS